MTKRNFAILATLTISASAFSQSSVPSTNSVQVITGAKLQLSAGQVIPVGDIVMRDGIIVAVGEHLEIPKGAEILDGKGLTVYAGFIDAYATKGLKAPAPIATPSGLPAYSDYTPSFMPRENRNGIHPDIEAATCFLPDSDMLKGWQSAGFTSAAVVPAGIIGGIGALENLSSAAPSLNTLNGSLGIGYSFDQPGGEGYPGSLLGVIAQMRQTLADSFSDQWTSAAYRQGGAVRPPFDPATSAIASHRNQWAFFRVNSAAEIDRVLQISREFQLKPVIVGGLEAWRRIPELKSANVPVIASLAFGVEPAEKVKAKPDEKKDDTTVDDDGQDADSPEVLVERKRRFSEGVSNIKQLLEAGIPVSFTSYGTKDSGEFLTNLRKVVAAGVTTDAALQALTTSPAALFNLGDRLGTITAGRIANLTVMSGDMTNEKSKVKIVFIDGKKIEMEKEVAPKQKTPRPEHEEGIG